MPASPRPHPPPPRARPPPMSPRREGDAPLTPRRYQSHDESILSGSPVSTNSTGAPSSPMREAASLIQSLDIARTKMIGSAADAATEAETARRNARTAQEIARRYQSGSYSTFKMNALDTSASSAASIVTTATMASSSILITSRPKHPDITGLFKNQNALDGGEDEEKTFEGEGDSPNGNVGGDDNNGGDNHRVPYTPSPRHSSPTHEHAENQIKSSDKKSGDAAQNRGDFHSPTSFERIAQHHADDLLQLTMELEKTKQELESEQRLRKQFHFSMLSMETKATKLESINEKLKEDIEKERKQSAAEISNLKMELKSSQMKLQAAEEDAQLALDLAKDSAEEREKTEELLQKAKNEVEMLRQQGGNNQLAVIGTPERRVHFADSDANAAVENEATNTVEPEKEVKSPALLDASREGGPSRAMIAAGRQLLLRRSMSPQDAVIRLELTPSKSAERRQQLSARLNKSLNESTDDANITLLSSSPSRTPTSPTPGSPPAITSGESHTTSNSITNLDMKTTLEEYVAAIKTLETSGKRLDLDGYFWREHSKNRPSHTPIRIDQMTRQYCQNVEFKIGRQQKDINQLESLLGYLEKKLVLDE